MAIKLPERNYFTFPEIMVRWQCTENDIRQIIINEALIPSYFIGENLEYSELEPRDQFTLVTVEVDDEMKFFNAGFYYLRMGNQIGPFDCQFGAFSKSRESINFAKGERGKEYLLKEALSLSEVLKKGVITMEELVIVERELSNQSDRKKSNDDLGSKERVTLLTIIAALCTDVGYDYTKHAKTAGLIKSTAAKMGVSIGETTIENHLKKIPDALGARMK